VCHRLREKIKNAKRTQIEKCINPCSPITNAKISKIALKKRTHLHGPSHHKIRVNFRKFPSKTPLPLCLCGEKQSGNKLPQGYARFWRKKIMSILFILSKKLCLSACRAVALAKAGVPLWLERLKKNYNRSAARNFGVLARLSEGVCPQRPVTERKRSQNPKEPLPLFLNRTATVFLKML
jgi:hypothetical protein